MFFSKKTLRYVGSLIMLAALTYTVEAQYGQIIHDRRKKLPTQCGSIVPIVTHDHSIFYELYFRASPPRNPYLSF